MKIKISLAASALLLSSALSAGTVNLNEGWNLVTVPSDVAINKSQISNLNSITTFNGMSPVPAFAISTLEVGKGYWLNMNSSTTLTFDDGDIRLPSFQPGWNLVGLPSGTKDVLSNTINDAGYKFDSIMTFNGMSPVPAFAINELDTTKGYWVYLQAIGATVETADGFDVKLYVDSPNDDISTLATSLSNYTLAELGTNTSLDFSDVSNLVVTTNINGTDVSTTYLNPNDSGFNTALTAEIRTTLDQTYTETAQATSGASIYIYGASEGGSPFILNSVNVFAVNTDGSRGALVGTTSATGYLYLSSVSTDPLNPTKVMIEKDGFESSLQEITAVAGGASYLFISEDDGTGNFDFSGVSLTDTVVARVLNDTRELIYPGNNGYIGLKPGSSTKRNSGLNINNRALRAFPLYNDISSKLDEPGFSISLLGQFFARGKSSATNNRLSYKAEYSDIFNFDGAGTLEDIRETISIKNMNADLKDRMIVSVEEGTLNEFKSNIEVYALLYVNSAYSWELLDNSDFDLVVNNSEQTSTAGSTDFTTNQSSYIADYGSNVDALVKVKGSALPGPRSVFAIFKENVTDNVDLSYNTYTLNVTVKDENGDALPNSAITLTRGTAGTDIIKSGDATGQVSFDLLVAPNQNETFSLGVMQGNHYPVSTTYNISGLNPVVDGNSSTDLVVSLMAPPEYATVKGEVSDTTAATISNAKVNLVFPIALADVQKDVVKVIDDQQLKGVSVSNIPNTRYSWYIKKHTDVLDNTTPTRALARVSSDRWILVQRGSAAQDANFLSYNKVVNQVLSRPLDNDPDDVKIVASGQFDIAVQVEHDIDSDGSYDFTELAVNNENTSSNLSGEEFSTSVDNDYGRTIGFISTQINVEALYEASGGADLSKDIFYASENGVDFVAINGTNLLNDESLLATYKTSKYLPQDLVFATEVDEFGEEYSTIGDSEVQDAFRITGNLDYGRLELINGANSGEMKSVDWDMSITSAIEDVDNAKADNANTQE